MNQSQSPPMLSREVALSSPNKDIISVCNNLCQECFRNINASPGGILAFAGAPETTDHVRSAWIQLGGLCVDVNIHSSHASSLATT